jgi:hypothetical protein
MRSQRRYAIRGCSRDPAASLFAVEVYLYKICRHCSGMVSEQWNLTKYEATSHSRQHS